LNILAWNFEFAPRRGKALPVLKERYAATNADIGILSEVRADAMPDGHAIFASPDWAYSAHPQARKVSLVSKSPWRNVHTPRSGRPLEGRLVSGVTNFEGQDCLVIGMCIPWSFCHVTSGQRDSERWQEHKAFLAALPDELGPVLDTDMPVILGGDFNHTFPRKRTDEAAHSMVLDFLARFHLTLVTEAPPFEGRLLNHIAVRGAAAGSLTRIENMSGDKQLTDHIGAVARLRLP
tara:strand:+ start:541 stop:1245 length:705 start_codon:yes stop_codon:yes gene_type:complete